MEDQSYKSRAERAAARLRMVKSYRLSGKNQREFCEDAGLDVSTLKWWTRESGGNLAPAAMTRREVA
jgi:hypothetical protein